MCGIAGFVGSGDSSDLKKMTNYLYHRGPDESGFYIDKLNSVFLGHRRLSIIDIAGGSQPMKTEDENLIVIFNGEIYNHLEIRNILRSKGYSFKTKSSDTEVLLHGYLEWGPNLVNYLKGMWSFAIYDKKDNIILLSRDHVGKKPLYYTFNNNNFIFSSELTSLIQHREVSTSLNYLNIKKYYAYGYFPGANTILSNVWKLEGGNNLIFNISEMHLTIKKYWDFTIEPFENLPKNPEKVWSEELNYLLQQAVTRRLPADVPLGFFLSGGIDSSAIVAIARSLKKNQSLRTFSIGFNEPEFDESANASFTAKKFGTTHFNSMLSMEDAKKILLKATYSLDEPMADSSILPTYLLCQEVSKYISVALSGDGADELFAGYAPFMALNLASNYDYFVPKKIHKAISLLCSKLPVGKGYMNFDFKLKRTLKGMNYPWRIRNPVWLGPLSPGEIEECFRETIDIEELYSDAIDIWENCKSNTITDKTLTFYTKLYLQSNILVKVDRASMRNSIEVRSPFLDIDLINFVRKIPYQFKIRNKQQKYILKYALREIVGRDIITNKKHGFAVPIGKWFNNDNFLLQIHKNIHFNRSEEQFYNKKLCLHKKGYEDNKIYLWAKFILDGFLNETRIL